MTMVGRVFVGLIGVVVSMAVLAENNQWQSSTSKTTLLELYTSEGCSSCPSADRWLSKWKDSPQLWVDVVPVAFHVDYWDDLGWKDDWASAEYSRRQRQYSRQGHTKAVYTPGIVVGGKEWRGYFSGKRIPRQERSDVGVLSASFNHNQTRLNARFTPNKNREESLVLYVALLAMDVTNDIGAGENEGRVLKHDFVVLDLLTSTAETLEQEYSWQLNLAADIFSEKKERPDAIAIWVSTKNSLVPLQAAGGLIRKQ